MSFLTALKQACDQQGFSYLEILSGLYITCPQTSTSVIVNGSKSSLDSLEGIEICHSKIKTEEFLKSLGIPTVTSRIITTDDLARGLIQPATTKTVIKPDQGSNSIGVGITPANDIVALVKNFMQARGVYRGPVIQQEFIPGRCYRVQVLKKEIMFVVEKCSTGDAPACISTGSERIVITDPVAPAVTRVCKEIAHRLSMHSLGIDILSNDITAELGVVLELNENPLLLPHRAPEFLQSLF
jgi:glutathione synthase/RimK-type ligase-like ATP-grasp enzyme